MTRRRLSIPAYPEGRDLAKTVAADTATLTEGVPFLDPWGLFAGFASLAGFPIFSREKSQVWAKHWSVLWEDQVRRCGFYCQWRL